MLTLQSTNAGLKAFTDIFCLTEVGNCHIVLNTAETVATVETVQTLKKLHKVFLWPKNVLVVSFLSAHSLIVLYSSTRILPLYKQIMPKKHQILQLEHWSHPETTEAGTSILKSYFADLMFCIFSEVTWSTKTLKGDHSARNCIFAILQSKECTK